MLITPARLVVIASLLSAVVSPSAGAQDLQYRRTLSTEAGGTAGRIMSAFPGGDGSAIETTFLKGNRIRQDQDDSRSTIVDWATGTLTLLDHRARTFTQVNLFEVTEAAEEAATALDGTVTNIVDAAAEGAETAAGETEQQYRDEGGDQFGLDVLVGSSRTGRTETIAGFTAEQVLVTLEIKGEKDVAEWDAEDTRGGLAIVTEAWLSTDFPEHRLVAQVNPGPQQDEEPRTDEGILGAIEYLVTYDPRVRFAFEKNQETLDAMDGVPLRTITHFVSLPDEARLDADAVLAEADRSLMDDATDRAAQTAKDVARSAVGGLRGRLFGSKNESRPEPGPEPEAEDATQSVFFRITSEVSDVVSGPLPEALFQIPSDYTPVDRGTITSGQ